MVCLFELRTQSSNNFVASVSEIDNEIKVYDFCEWVINSFQEDMCCIILDLKSLVREKLVRDHSSIFAKNLTNDELDIIFDDIYLSHQQIKNNWYQRR